MPDFLFNEMKKLYPDDSDEQMMAKIQGLDTPIYAKPEEPVVEPNPYKEMAIENVRQKYLGDKYNDVARQKIIDENKEENKGPNIMAGLAAFGTGLAGGNAIAAGQSLLNAKRAKQEARLNEFDTGRKSLLEDVKTGQELTKYEQDQTKLARERDPNSDESKMAQGLAIQMGMKPEEASKLTAEKFKDFSPVMEKKYQIAQNALSRKDALEAARMTREDSRMDRQSARQEKSAEKREQVEKLNPHQVEGIADFDTTIDKANAALASLGNHSEWTGSLDARVPDMFVGGDQVAFRSAVGRMADAYRKLITGAGASNQELARLEGRLPQASDTFENFKAKAKSLIEETKRAKQSHLNAYEKSGKNVQEFKGDSLSEVPPGEKPSWAK